MRSYRTTRRTAAVAAAAALAAGLLAGCASDDDSGDEPAKKTDAKGKTTITIGLFGAFGFEEAGLYDDYMKANPNITIKQTVIERNENYYPALLTHLASNSGLSDIQGIEVANIAEVVQTQSDKFMDLSKVEGFSTDNFLEWKWKQAATKDGKVIGTGTDIGPMAICYRKDKFQEAGLPTDREEVAKLWAGDWQKYLDTGKQFMEKAPKGTAWVDSAGGLYNAAISSSASRYYDENGEVFYKTNPDVKAAFDVAASAADQGMTAKLEQFTDPWNTAMAEGTFATISCPAWMQGYIEDQAGEKNKGKWDVAAPPKAGNWGGSFLGVPEAGKNKEEAAKLAAWLTAPEQQAKLFAERGSFPSAPPAFDMPAVADAKNEFFENAPIGAIYAEAAKGIPVQVIGPKDQIIQENIGRGGLLQIEQGKKNPADAWEAAQKAVDNVLDQ